jgi:putative transposase
MGWAQTHGIRHILIQPGRPMQNGYIESFNGKFRGECLNLLWLESLEEAKVIIEAWRRDYNNESRPHMALGDASPLEFARQLVARAQFPSALAAEN